MKIKFIPAILLLFIAHYGLSQRFYFPNDGMADKKLLTKQMSVLAKQVIAGYMKAPGQVTNLNDLFRLKILAGDYAAANETIDSLRLVTGGANPPSRNFTYIQYELYAKARLLEKQAGRPFEECFTKVFNDLFFSIDDKTALDIYTAFLTRNGIAELQDVVDRSLLNFKDRDSLDLNEATGLCKAYFLLEVYGNIEPTARQLLKADDQRRYIIEDSVLIKTKQGATLSAVVARKRNVDAKLPATLFFTIYADLERNLLEAKQSAARGYAGVVADTRGKRLSPDPVEPYEHEVEDVPAVIDWTSRQPWCNGKVGMYGGSYVGYAQWAATKHLHPALKTIVPYVAAIPGLGLPMENNVFLNANYAWAFYVTDNKYLDNEVYFDPARWNTLLDKWYASGVPYGRIDSIDGTPNKWLHRWLQHPAYDKYWQVKVPYKNEFAGINIPVLTIEGYYDDGQVSGLQYFREHYKYNKKANHYLIIGPYDHFGTQTGGTPELRGYKIDPAALINTREITFQWLDYILKNGERPGILQDKVNFEVMGANAWRHAPTLAEMSDTVLTLYLSDSRSGNNYQLKGIRPLKPGFISQRIDLADRKTANSDYYPDLIIKEKLDTSNSLFFISEPFDKTVSISGSFSGKLRAAINKKDMDLTITLYEVMPNGQFFHLSYFIGRASYAKDVSTRRLLIPGKIETIPFERSRVVSKQLSKGSRLLVVININKNPFAEVNYGTGRNVSEESLKDARIPLQVKWYNDSFIKIPIGK